MMRPTCIIVQKTTNCIKLLRYIDKNILDINAAGIIINIEPLPNNCDGDVLKLCKKYGITWLPALISHNGDITIGHTQIIEKFKSLTQQSTIKNMVSPIDNEYDKYIQKELYTKDTTGKCILRTDDDLPEDEFVGRDIDKKLKEYQSKTNPTNKPKPIEQLPPVDATINVTAPDNVDDDMLRALLEKMQ